MTPLSDFISYFKFMFIWISVRILNIASKILEMVESLGMLPTYNENHGISNYDLAMGQPVEATNKWENE